MAGISLPALSVNSFTPTLWSTTMDKAYYEVMMHFFWNAMCDAQENGEPLSDLFDSYAFYSNAFRSA